MAASRVEDRANLISASQEFYSLWGFFFRLLPPQKRHCPDRTRYSNKGAEFGIPGIDRSGMIFSLVISFSLSLYESLVEVDFKSFFCVKIY